MGRPVPTNPPRPEPPPVPALDYLRDPDAIYAESFARIGALCDLGGLPAELRPVALRVVHASGMPEIARGLAWRGEPVAAARAALLAGAPVLCDVQMVAAGVIRRLLPAANPVLCTLDDPRVPDLASGLGTTRSAAAVELWRPRLDGAVVLIGNAPTALFHLLERLGDWPERPAAVFGFPVGFVGAAESKDALLADGGAPPALVLRGRPGGSAVAAAALNALFASGAA
ncbi:MAG: precorrin-8X methylmutase [Geminicoccaceae bacterium]|nr:precorrin-8X methylmutase [Geminicoccaceae bacterium]